MTLVYAGVAAQSSLDSILYDFHHRPDRILVASHRASHPDLPENSLAAIRETIRSGIDIVELDIRETKDGVLVIMHDKTVDRTTNSTGLVAEKSFAELQQLRLVHNGQVTQEKIPTLKEVLQLVKGKIMLDIDYKAEGRRAARSTAKLIRKMKMEDQCLFFLYDYKDAAIYNRFNKRIQYLARAYNSDDVNAILSLPYKIPAVHGDHKFYTDSLMVTIRNSGKRVWMNALGKIDEAEKTKPGEGFPQLLLLKQTNIIQTDLPVALLRYLQSAGRHR